MIDCANGVGAPAAKTLNDFLGESLSLELKNTWVESAEKLNKDCGADYVKVNQKLPPSLESVLKPGQRGCSLDGDADRLIYYYLNNSGKFRMLDGDKITTLVASFIVKLVKDAGLEDLKIKVGVVQTAYANGSSTRYLSEVRVRTPVDGNHPYPPAEASCDMRANGCQALAPCRSREVRHWSIL